VQICDRLRFQFDSVFFGPFSRADQAVFLCIPATENDGSSGLPTLLQQLTKSPSCFKHCCGTAIRIDCAKRPGITMVAHDYPAIFFLVTINSRNYIPDFANLIIHIRLEVDAHFIGPTYVVRKRESSLKTFWPDGPLKRLK